MPHRNEYYVYILASKSRVLYIGVTNDLKRRVFEHKSGAVKGFAWRYHVQRLVYVEESDTAEEAIARERQLKNWHRDWKINLIEQSNPAWRDLTEELGGAE
jgi:putative endonuclease